MYCLAFCFEFLQPPYGQNKAAINICREEKVIIRLTFNPGLPLTGFRTILPCFQQVNLT